MSNTQVICQAAVAINGVKRQWPIMSQYESEMARQLREMDLWGETEGGQKRPGASVVGKGPT